MKKSTASSSVLDPAAPVPLYEQLKDRLVAELADATSAVGAATVELSDSALMERFGVSRVTVRTAIAELVRSGHVLRVPGRGTFAVREPTVALDLDGVDKFFEEWHLRELDPGTTLLAFRHVTVPAEIAVRLQIPRGATVLLLRRMRKVRGIPATLDVRYVVDWCARGITREDAERDMLFDIVARRVGAPTTAVEQDVGAQAADPASARLLGVAEGTPLLSRQVTFFTTGDRPIITGNGLYRSDRFRFHMRAQR
ncbi:MAG: GntR family transcriptional regulator [Vulcanimicrobiaceae bacterium]